MLALLLATAAAVQTSQPDPLAPLPQAQAPVPTPIQPVAAEPQPAVVQPQPVVVQPQPAVVQPPVRPPLVVPKDWRGVFAAIRSGDWAGAQAGIYALPADVLTPLAKAELRTVICASSETGRARPRNRSDRGMSVFIGGNVSLTNPAV